MQIHILNNLDKVLVNLLSYLIKLWLFLHCNVTTEYKGIEMRLCHPLVHGHLPYL